MAVLISNSGRWISDPSEMPGASVVSNGLDESSTTLSTAAGFWTGEVKSIDRMGVVVDSNWTANTYKNLLSLTATKAGFVGLIVGPTLATAGDTFTPEVTVDGALYTLPAFVAQANTSRVVVGFSLSIGGYYGTNGFDFTYTAAPSDGITQYIAGARVISCLSAMWQGVPMLRFTSSLLIRAKVSQNLSATANQERQAGVIYMRTS